MKLDLGADGKIIGTRRVSPNGQVSGLSEYSGREVLVILPGVSNGTEVPGWPPSEDLTQLVSEQIRQAYQRYRALQEAYATPWEATRSFLQSAFGGQVPDLLAQVDRWVKGQVQDATRGRSAPAAEPSEEGPAASTRGAGARSTKRSKGSAGGRP